MNNKRGWIRIMEATIGVLLVTSILVVVYTRQPDRSIDSSEYLYNLQQEILGEITLNETLRKEVLSSTNGVIPPLLEEYLTITTPLTIESRLIICELQNPPLPCKLSATDFQASYGKDVYAEQTIISSNLTLYDPKKIVLYMWENR